MHAGISDSASASAPLVKSADHRILFRRLALRHEFGDKILKI
jgi:hypothetical protein